MSPSGNPRQDAWTRDTVCAAIIAAFRRPQGGYLATPRQVELALNWRIRVPQLAAQDWRYLLAWAQARAGGPSLSTMCAASGWTRSTADDGWRRAADTIAAALNAEDVNAAAALAGSAARWRLSGQARGRGPDQGQP